MNRKNVTTILFTYILIGKPFVFDFWALIIEKQTFDPKLDLWIIFVIILNATELYEVL